MKILLADDEKILRITIRDSLEDAGHIVTAVEDGQDALDALGRDIFDCVITDLNMPRVGGEKVLKAARQKESEVIVITGAGSVASAVAAMKEGAFDFIEKPFDIDDLLLLLGKVEKMVSLKREVAGLKAELHKDTGFSRLSGTCQSINPVIETARAAANTDAGILIEGQSGTGKEVFARAIHEESERKDKPFVVISCGILAENLLESELFGHEKGAFTGADSERKGRFEIAEGGTVFLDDIDDMPLATQVKLLRVLQERTLERIGSSTTIPVDIRVIAATKVDLKKLVRGGSFREDLFYRLNIINIKLPLLSERPDDIPLLVAYFIVKHGNGKEYRVLPGTLAKMQGYAWPGNIRELENAVLRAISLCDSSDNILSEKLLVPQPGRSTTCIKACKIDNIKSTGLNLNEATKAVEEQVILAALKETSGNRTKAAELLGISRKHLWDKMKKMGIDNGA